MNHERLIEKFMDDFNIGRRQLYYILNQDCHHVPPSHSNIISDRKQLRLMARLGMMAKYPESYRKSGPGRPGRLRFSLSHLRFLMGEFELKDSCPLNLSFTKTMTAEQIELLTEEQLQELRKKDSEAKQDYLQSAMTDEQLQEPTSKPKRAIGQFASGETIYVYGDSLKFRQSLERDFDLQNNNPSIRIKGELPSKSVVRRRVEGNDSKFRWKNLVYLGPYLEKKWYKGSPWYFCPGYIRGSWREREGRLIRMNITGFKKVLREDIQSTKNADFIPSPELDGVFYLRLEKQDEELVKELDPLAKEIQRKMYEYRRKFMGWRDGKPMPGFKNGDFRSVCPFMVIYYE